MDLKQLAKELEPFDYVVQRNWQSYPEGLVPGHEDVDLFCSEEDRDEVEIICKGYDLVDVRSATDRYYPDEINSMLLQDKREFNGFKIPSRQAYFLSLYYHDVVHKGGIYSDELKKAFLDWQPPVRCVDEGVGYYV